MRYCFALAAAGALFLSPMLAETIAGEQAQQPPSVQVGVPEGRQGGARQGGQGQGGQQGQGGAQGRQGGGRGGRAAGPPPPPAPRNAAGRVIFGSGDPK